jgi:UDP-GlcNAc3NAcA epimerase
MPEPLVLTVVGNRPQYVKAAVLSPRLRRVARELLLDTGQHYDHELAGLFFEQLALPEPDIALGVGSGSHAAQTAAMLTGVEQALERARPDLVLVYGDTNSTLAGALAAAKLNVPVAHVEAGLRSFDRSMPEEVNRLVADHLAALLFCPTEAAVGNLRTEGVTEGVHKVGDVMFDLARDALTREVEAAALDRFGVQRGAYVFATLHRPATVDRAEHLGAVLRGLAAAGEPVLFPAHPRTVASIARFGLAGLAVAWPPVEVPAAAAVDDTCADAAGVQREILGPGLHVVEPVGYLESLTLAKNARVVATDSGGLQKEAYFVGTPCVTMRDTTEWVETVESGWNVLVGADGEALARALAAPPRGADHPAFYGEGDAGERIAAVVAAFCDRAGRP